MAATKTDTPLITIVFTWNTLLPGPTPHYFGIPLKRSTKLDPSWVPLALTACMGCALRYDTLNARPMECRRTRLSPS